MHDTTSLTTTCIRRKKVDLAWSLEADFIARDNTYLAHSSSSAHRRNTSASVLLSGEAASSASPFIVRQLHGQIGSYVGNLGLVFCCSRYYQLRVHWCANSISARLLEGMRSASWPQLIVGQSLHQVRLVLPRRASFLYRGTTLNAAGTAATASAGTAVYPQAHCLAHALHLFFSAFSTGRSSFAG